MSSWESAAIIRAKEMNEKANDLNILVSELSTLSKELLNDVLSDEAIAIIDKRRKAGN